MTRYISNYFLAAILCFLVVPQSASAQDTPDATKRVIDDVRRDNPALTVKINPHTGMPTRIKGLRPVVDPIVSLGASRDASGAPSEADARQAAERFFLSGALSAAFEAKNTRTKVESVRVRKDPDIRSQHVVHVEQRVDGVPVFGSSGRVIVSPSLTVTQLTTTFSAVDVEKTTPDITKERAIEVARAELNKILNNKRRGRALDRLRSSTAQAKAEATLVVFDPALTRAKGAKPGPTRLSWLTTIDSFRFFVDAQSSEVLFYYMDQRWAMQRRVFDLNQSFDFPSARLVIDESAGAPGSDLPEDVDLAFKNAGHVSTFFGEILGRETVLESGNEGFLESYVRFGDRENAYWCTRTSIDCPAAGVMVYGVKFASALDVAGHEITHGVITEEANLTYANEAGAVNESIADILGTLIEFRAQPGSSNWVLGEVLPGYTRISALRNMADPRLSDQDGNPLFDKSKPYSPSNRGQPDHYADYVQREDPICETTNDYYNGCVHFNSGIFNKFAFLVAEGGRHRGLTVKGIGRPKLEKITYRALVTQLNPSSGLIESAEGFWFACSELAQFGAAGFTSDDCDKVRQAQTAVGLISAGS